ncbi:LOW QUALITY PROTEIN: G-protein coupled receptor 157 [Eubalaena glacialis]|uniref:LOW QUALITY PROTEIN: G-protein coupled receptor 157 n=1 Tax=Eubalaena glacialis TaxID=27606 RepID=UPI002A5ADD63|nr:LOW QUALITY PROTEIN: G-protein coupled receptor 157 [Eubalaena glacialis]
MPPPAPPTELVPSERAVVLLSCALSALGSGLLVATHALWPDLRSRARRLLLFLSLADLLSAASYFYGVLQDFEGPSWDCVLQGALSTFANTSSFFWTVAIALYLYLSIVRTSRGPGDGRLLCAFHVVSWGVPLVITVAAVTLKKIGYDASDVSVGWCWIDLEAEDHVLWMLLTGKVWEMLAYVTLPVLYLLIRKHINRAHEALSEYRPLVSRAHQLRRRTSAADKKLVLIPIIFICLRVWSTVRFVLTLCGSPAVQTPVLVVLHGIGNSFQGGANCIMFVLCTRTVRTRLLSLCCCCTSQPSARREPAGPRRASAPSKTGESQGPRRAADELPSARAAPLLVLCLGAADLGQAAPSPLCRERDISCAVSLRLPKLLSPVGSSANSACLPPRPSSTSPSHRVLLHVGEFVGMRAALSFRETRGT